MKKATSIVLLLLLGGFVLGMLRLFQLRFETGDVYPQYSSLRADPLGAKALHESLHKLVRVERNYRPLGKLATYDDATVFFLGINGNELECEPNEFKAIESFVREGGRLVIALLPDYDPPGPGGPRPGPVPARQGPDATPPVLLTKKWDFEIGHAPVLRDAKGVYRPAAATLQQEVPGLPEKINVHTALFFTNSAAEWNVLYERRGELPVIIERKIGAGTITLCADSYYFSNEALLKDRQPELLSWFVGDNSRIVFDETHLGVTESPGVAALARKYRLHGLFAGLLLLGALYVWKNSSSLIPRGQADNLGGPEVIFGRDTAAGFVNLMRRNIPQRDLLAVCLKEWRHSCSQGVSRAKLEEIQRVIDEDNARERGNPLEVYRAISRILHQRKLRLT